MPNANKIIKRALCVPAALVLGACCCSEPAAKLVPLPDQRVSRVPAVSLGDIFFDFDRANLKSESEAQLRKNADWMVANMSKSIIIEGHCDERGTAEYNIALGDRRAQSAMNGMMRLGVDQTRMTTVSYGEEKPFASGHNEAAWAKNRRVHFVEK